MFKTGDIFIYSIIAGLLTFLCMNFYSLKGVEGKTVEIYVDNKLKFVEELVKEPKHIFVPTELGGIEVELIDNKVKVISSNSPKKLIVKQGFISKSGETLIGIPDKVLIKISGENDLDYVIK